MTLRFIFRVGVSVLVKGLQGGVEREGSHSCQANYVTMLRALMLNNGIRAGEEAHCYVVHAMWSGGSTESSFIMS